MNLKEKGVWIFTHLSSVLQGVEKYFDDPRMIQAYESFNKEVGRVNELNDKYEIIVYHNHSLVRHLKSKFAVVRTHSENSASIYVDDLFMESSKEIQQCIILHEIGHIIDRPIIKSLNDHMRSEKMADEYAASVIGYEAVVNAMGDILANYGSIINSEELRQRMTHMIILRNREKSGFSQV